MALSLSWLRDYFRECPLVFCDGDGVRLGLWMFGQAPPPKTTYNVWIWEMARWAERNGFSLYLLGGMPGIAEQAGRRLTEAFPKLRVAGTHDGYFQKQGAENERLIEEVNRLSPDVLLVCFGLPFQEEWTQKNASRLAAHILLTGGAALDYAAGRVAVAPGWVVRWHMEWLFRLWLEPVRMFRRYVLGNPLFLARVMRQMARQPRRSALD
jgi:N-acetylglucosaminyldiphosphoundecaprenol N-acetyl-beta-D-mannosaminyltransferase